MSADNQAARTRVFAKLKSVLKDGPPAAERRTHVEHRLAAPPKHPRPARIAKSHDDLRALFRAHLVGQSATFVEVASAAEVPAAIAQYLRANNLPQRVRAGSDAALAVLPWSKEPTLQRDAGAAAGTDETGLSRAVAGVAETGTLALVSGVENPVTLNYVPETHIVVVDDTDIVGGYEDVWPKVRARFGAGQMPRTVNFISGPSRTGDIGGKLVMGAHGPRRMCVILVRNA
jgi:L-lactate dehydrogenase complex protein LldG